MKKIIAVFKTHFDIGFTGLSSEVIEKIKVEQLDSVMQTVKTCPKYVWTMPSWPFSKCFEGDSERENNVRSLVESGNLCWHGLPYTTHTEFCGVEDYIRGMSISDSLSKKFGKQKPISAKMTDVPGHTRGLVSILAKSGIKFIHLGTNPATMPPNLPRLFYWEAQDGSKVLVFYSKGGYGTELLPPDDWEYPVWMALLQTGDNLGPQDGSYVDNLKKNSSGYDFEIGTMDDFYYELLPYLKDIPVVTLDVADTWIHGVASYPSEVAKVREQRFLAKQLEALALRKKSDVNDEFYELYDNLLLFGEHTWGLDVKWALGGDRKYEKSEFQAQLGTDKYKRIEKSWDEQRERVQIVDHILTSVQQRLGEGMCLFNGGAKRHHTTFLLDESLYGKKLMLENGEPIISFKVDDKQYGYIYELPEFSSLEIKVCGDEELREFADYLNTTVFNKSGFFRYEYDVFSLDDITNFIRDYSYRFFDWSIADLGRLGYPDCEHKKYHATTKESYENYGNAKVVEEIMHISPFTPCVDVKLKLYDKQKTPFVESGNFVFSFNLKDDYKVRVNKFGGVVDIENDIADNANHSLYCCDQWINLYDDEKGVLVIPKHTPLFSLGQNEVCKFRGKYKKQPPVLYFNLFNNSWGTNFPQWIGGNFEFDFRFIPYEGRKSDAECFALANDYMFTPILCDESFPKLFSLDEDFEVLALKKSYNHDAIVLRIYDTKGEKRSAKINLINSNTYCSCNLLEEPDGDFKNGSVIEFNTNPYEIHTFLIKENL